MSLWQWLEHHIEKCWQNASLLPSRWTIFTVHVVNFNNLFTLSCNIRNPYPKSDPANFTRNACKNYDILSCRTVVQSLTHTLLNQHEVITVARYYGKKQYPLLTSLVSLIQDDLRKKNYTSFAELQSTLVSCDHDKLGFISKDLLRHICRGNELPLSDQLIDGTIMKWASFNNTARVYGHVNNYMLTWSWSSNM